MTVPSNVDPLDIIQALLDAHVDFCLTVDGERMTISYSLRWCVEHFHGHSFADTVEIDRDLDSIWRTPHPWLRFRTDGEDIASISIARLSRISRYDEDAELVPVWTPGNQWGAMADDLTIARNRCLAVSECVEDADDYLCIKARELVSRLDSLADIARGREAEQNREDSQ